MAVQPVILTTPQRQGARVERIVTALRGLGDPIVHCDERRVGAAAATRDALLSAGADGDHVLFVEDDVLVDDGAAEAVGRMRFPDGVAVISFCDMREVPEFSAAGVYRRSALGSDGHGWWGNQALLIHRDTVDMLARRDWFAPEIEDSRGIRIHKVTYEDEGRNCSDIRMALLIHMFGGDRREYAVHVPSLFKHVGYESMCFPGRGMGERETRNWIGDRRRYAPFAVDQPASVMI